MTDTTAIFGKSAFACPHCHAYTSQTWFELYAKRSNNNEARLYDPEGMRQIVSDLKPGPNDQEAEVQRNKKKWEAFASKIELGDPAVSADVELERVSIAGNVHLSICYVCQRESLWLRDRLIYPQRVVDAPSPNEDMPADIKLDYEEAASIAGSSPRAAAGLLRLAIQKLCLELLQKPKGDINSMIATLVERGLDPTIQQALDSLRVIGNEAVHPGSIDLRDGLETVQKLFKLVNVVVENMITRPRQIGEIYAMIPENKRAEIEKRDAKKPNENGRK